MREEGGGGGGGGGGREKNWAYGLSHPKASHHGSGDFSSMLNIRGSTYKQRHHKKSRYFTV